MGQIDCNNSVEQQGVLSNIVGFARGLNSLYVGYQDHAIGGVVDSGIKINYSEDVLPSDDRIEGKHIESYGKVKSSANITKQFAEIKKKILSE